MSKGSRTTGTRFIMSRARAGGGWNPYSLPTSYEPSCVVVFFAKPCFNLALNLECLEASTRPTLQRFCLL